MKGILLLLLILSLSSSQDSLTDKQLKDQLSNM